MGKEKEVPREYLKAMEPASYADGDFDIGAWEDEIMDMKADDIVAEGDFEGGDTDHAAYTKSKKLKPEIDG